MADFTYTSPSFIAGEATADQIAGYLIAGLMFCRGRRVQITIQGVHEAPEPPEGRTRAWRVMTEAEGGEA